MKYNVRIYGDSVLRKNTEPVTEFNNGLREIVDNMIETIYEDNGLGLAAPQVGILKKIIVIDLSFGKTTDETMTLINPEILDTEGECVMEEGCLSVPGIYADVTRPEKIRLAYDDVDGAGMELEVDGMLGRVIQHETDHLEGVLFVDRLGTVKRNLLVKSLRELTEKGTES